MTIKYLRYNYTIGLRQNIFQRLAECEAKLSQSPGDIDAEIMKKNLLHDDAILQKYSMKLAKEINMEIEDQTGEKFKLVVKRESKVVP